VSGRPKSYLTKADTATVTYPVTFWFCPDCGSPSWRDGEMVLDARIIRARTLEVEKARDDAKPAVELYTVSRVDWLQGILGVTQFAHMF
jgi:hypothetical protein